MQTKKLTMSALLIAIGVVAGNIIYIPVGVSKCFPIQHLINVLSAVILGPTYAVLNAFVISLIRNILGTGSLLAFPGSMIGAFLAGIMFKKTRSKLYAVVGEIFGTGILGGIVAYPIAKFIMGKEVAVFFFVIPFLISTVGGSIIAYAVLTVFEKTKILSKYTQI
ncbi:energy coupling factor transporter S component ThiW [Clostridium sp. cel8]|jgi:energy coupling factor transporter S component ThiW|uniref:energy coupling factor transporter S component ThiW n=1 Tax=Clostridium sp. cel8 TaxID=2663123 RepID=UPI0015F55BFE|nr:energy coupling factor transporter S component ThiW [Clostridium sp. cel8]MBA5851274.1 energy coupling factor transporter S component ThiW [Clostridium sp. cel8]